ncbi:hypothetical protein FWK35_00015135 [Aphis craccivora]|uniref:Uncharacterized protein n=1 Tax=Aphis craccivora TaxID=307492 RepID=A0A6G0Z1K3_APHCR|nr:hypothetical protein FWK35_00015135 [Aphis craccivora]
MKVNIVCTLGGQE